MQLIRRIFELLKGFAQGGECTASSGPLDFLDPVFVRDPYPTYKLLRQEDPIHRTRSGAWLLTRHRDIVEAFGHAGLSNAPSQFAVLAPRNKERYVCADVAGNILPFLDAPEHGSLRKLIARAYREQMKACPPDIPAIAQEILRPHLTRGRMDVMADYGKPLSIEVIARIMGLPASDYPALTEWSDRFFYLFAPMPSEAVRVETDEALNAFRAYFQLKISERRAKPSDDLISRLLSTEDEGRRLSDLQVADACMLLFSDGIQNVDAGIANTLLAVHGWPEQRRAFYNNTARASDFVAEGLRFDSPAQLIARIARADLMIGNTFIARESVVFLALGAGNRDPDVFPRPDMFDFNRDNSMLLTFGKGRHACIGGSLVRTQMEAALRSFFERTSRVEVRIERLTWRPRVGHRWLTSLPIEFASL